MHTSVLWWWWHPLFLLCDAVQSPCRWSCRCHRSHCRLSPPCQQYWDGRNSWPQLPWSYLRSQVKMTTQIGAEVWISNMPRPTLTCNIQHVSTERQICAKRYFLFEVVLLRKVNFGLICLTSFDQICQQLTPLSSELVGTRQTAITSNHTQVGDAQLDQVTGSLGASLLCAEILTAGTSNNSPTLMSSKKTGFQTRITRGQIRRRGRIIWNLGLEWPSGRLGTYPVGGCTFWADTTVFFCVFCLTGQ